MKKIIFLIVLLKSPALFADPDYDAVVVSSYPAAVKDVNYQIGYYPPFNTPMFVKWKVPVSPQQPNVFVSTPDFTALVNAYTTSPAKSTLDTKILQLKTKLNLTDTDLQTLKAALKQ